MSKTQIYSYIESIEDELRKVLENNPNAEVIIHEIVTEALMLVHDTDNFAFSDEEVAKGVMRMSVNSLYEAGRLMNIIDKFNNPRNRVFYGLRGRFCSSTESLMKSLDIRKVRDEHRALLLTIDKATLSKSNDRAKRFQSLASINNTAVKWLTGCVTVAVVAVAGMIILAPENGRSPVRSEKGVGEYVYIDDYDIVHADRQCSRLNSYKWQPSWRKRTAEFQMGSDYTVCPKCVSDKAYEQIMNVDRDN